MFASAVCLSLQSAAAPFLPPASFAVSFLPLSAFVAFLSLSVSFLYHYVVIGSNALLYLCVVSFFHHLAVAFSLSQSVLSLLNHPTEIL